MQTSTEQVERAPSKRKRNFAIFLIILLLIGAYCVAWYMLYARYYETTDDAYVNGNQVTLTPQIGGTVTQVSVDEGDYVEKGQPLVQLDPSDTEIALQQKPTWQIPCARYVGFTALRITTGLRWPRSRLRCKPRKATTLVARRFLPPAPSPLKIWPTIAMPSPARRAISPPPSRHCALI